LISVLIIAIPATAAAEKLTDQPSQAMRECIETRLQQADESITIKQLKFACATALNEQENGKTISDRSSNSSTTNTSAKSSSSEKNSNESHSFASSSSIAAATNANAETIGRNPEESSEGSALKDRLENEVQNRSNRFILTPHKRNFLLPITYSSHPNIEPYLNEDSNFTDLNHSEAEFQLSVKILLRENIFDHNGHLFLGYTNHSFWQVYNRKISAAFRESDHQPELILDFTNDGEIFGFRNVINDVILNHQSNGQPGLLSRSWNRVMLNSVFEKGNFAFLINPWYRIPESKQEYPGDAGGDDNPRISHYMGNFEFTGAYKYKSDILSVQVRNNLDRDNRGAIELGWTFPVTSNMRGYVTYFNGYGHSLIDYDAKQEVLGLGIIFTDLF
jgi:phospholipase A1